MVGNDSVILTGLEGEVLWVNREMFKNNDPKNRELLDTLDETNPIKTQNESFFKELSVEHLDLVVSSKKIPAGTTIIAPNDSPNLDAENKPLYKKGDEITLKKDKYELRAVVSGDVWERAQRRKALMSVEN